MDCSPPGSSVHGILQARILGCHFLLQGIFPTQGSNLHFLHLLHWQEGSLPVAPPGKPLQRHGNREIMCRNKSIFHWQNTCNSVPFCKTTSKCFIKLRKGSKSQVDDLLHFVTEIQLPITCSISFLWLLQQITTNLVS